MAVINLYTAAQVQNALLRGQVALLLISQKIQSNFLYFNNKQYSTFKDLQYDIYCLWIVCTQEFSYVDFVDSPSEYVYQYFELVGALIEKTKQVDVFGAYGGATNPNYVPPAGGTVVVINPSGALNFVKSNNIPFNTDVITLANWQTLYAPLYGQNPSIEIFTVQGGVDQKDTQTAPIYTYSTPGDESTLLQSISWSYPFTTEGYYTISGVVPGSSGSGSGSSSTYIIVPFGSPNISTDGDGNFVYTDNRLIGKSGYFANATMLTQMLVDGTDFTSNPALGSMTITNPPAFALIPGSFLIIFVN